jgi:hypothetical protein
MLKYAPPADDRLPSEAVGLWVLPWVVRALQSAPSRRKRSDRRCGSGGRRPTRVSLVSARAGPGGSHPVNGREQGRLLAVYRGSPAGRSMASSKAGLEALVAGDRLLGARREVLSTPRARARRCWRASAVSRPTGPPDTPARSARRGRCRRGPARSLGAAPRTAQPRWSARHAHPSSHHRASNRAGAQVGRLPGRATQLREGLGQDDGRHPRDPGQARASKLVVLVVGHQRDHQGRAA